MHRGITLHTQDESRSPQSVTRNTKPNVDSNVTEKMEINFGYEPFVHDFKQGY